MGADAAFSGVGVEQAVYVELEGLAGVFGDRGYVGVHADRVDGARLDAKAAEDAPRQVDVERDGIFHDRVVFVLAGSDDYAVGGANGRAAHACDAADRAVVPLHQTMPRAPALVDGPLYLGVSNGNGIFERIRDVLEEVARGYRYTPEYLGEIKPFQEVEFRSYLHPPNLQ